MQAAIQVRESVKFATATAGARTAVGPDKPDVSSAGRLAGERAAASSARLPFPTMTRVRPEGAGGPVCPTL